MTEIKTMQTVTTAPSVETYIEISRKRTLRIKSSAGPAANYQRPVGQGYNLASWRDLPLAYGRTGYNAGRLSDSDKETLYYIYQDNGIRFLPNEHGEYWVNLTQPDRK